MKWQQNKQSDSNEQEGGRTSTTGKRDKTIESLNEIIAILRAENALLQDKFRTQTDINQQ